MSALGLATVENEQRNNNRGKNIALSSNYFLSKFPILQFYSLHYM